MGRSISEETGRRVVFSLLILMNGLYQFAMSGTRPIIPIYAESLGVSSFVIGLLISAHSLLPMVLAVKIGKWVDTVGARRMVYIGSAGFVLAFAGPMLVPSLAALFVSQLLFGVSLLLVIISLQKTIANLPGDRDRLVTAHGLSAAAGDMIGPLLTGFAYERFGVSAAFAAAAAAVAACMAIGLFVRRRAWQGGAVPAAQRKESSGGTRELLRNVNLRKALVFSGVAQYSRELLVAYFPLYGLSQGMTAGEIGVVLSVTSLCSIAVRLVQFVIVRRFGRTRVMTASLAISAAMFALIGVLDAKPALYVTVALLGAGLGIGQPLAMVLSLNSTPTARHGEVLGVRFTINRMLQFAAPIVFGGVAGGIGLYAVFLINGCLMGAGAWFTHIRIRPDEVRANAQPAPSPPLPLGERNHPMQGGRQ